LTRRAILTAVSGHVVNRGVRDVWTGKRAASDDELVAEARLGGQEAFAIIYQRYKLDVWQLAWFTLRDRHEAEDVLQDTFVKAHRALAQYRHDGTLRPWLLTICRNACRDRLRSQRRKEVVALDEETLALAGSAGGDGGAGGPDHERAIDLHRAMAALPDEDREAFLLVDVLGCHSDEAAKVAGVRAASTLRSRLARARRALAPAVAEPDAAPRHTEVWGLYHSSSLNALVFCDGACDAPAAHAADLLAHVRAPRFQRPGPGDDLVGFLERLDRRIPDGRTVVAIVDDRPAGAGSWLAVHPRWRMQRAPTTASWVVEVDSVLARCTGCAGAERERLQAVLRGEDAFVWTGRP
jgi:RNA polymerase sigma-70 factor (ECF subfamily)